MKERNEFDLALRKTRFVRRTIDGKAVIVFKRVAFFPTDANKPLVGDRIVDRLGTRAYVSMKWQWIYPLRFSPFLRSLRSDPRWADSTRRADPVRIPQVARRA